MAQAGQDSDAVLDSILKLDMNKCSVHVCVAAYLAGEHLPIFQRLALTEELSNEFRAIVAERLQQWEKEREAYQLTLWPHLNDTKPDAHEFEHLDLASHDKIGLQLEALAQPPIALPLFTADDEIVSGIRFYVIVVQPPKGEPVYFFRTYTPKRELSRSRWFAALLSDGQFDKISEPTFLFDNRIDCFSVGQHMFIVQKSNFQAIFRFFEMVAEAATQTLATIKLRIPIKNFNEFAEDCQAHLQKLAKLKNIAEKPYLSKINMGDLQRVIAQLKLKIAVENVDGTEMLVYDRKDRWALLRLLDDDYVQSLLTNTMYEASGKRPLT